VRDIGDICRETIESLEGYIKGRLDQATLVDLASLVGNRFLTLFTLNHVYLRPSKQRCFDFLFLHEIVFECLIKIPEIRKKIGVDYDNTEIGHHSTKSLRKILSMQLDVEEDKVEGDKIATSRVIHCFNLLINRRGHQAFYFSFLTLLGKCTTHQNFPKATTPRMT